VFKRQYSNVSSICAQKQRYTVFLTFFSKLSHMNIESEVFVDNEPKINFALTRKFLFAAKILASIIIIPLFIGLLITSVFAFSSSVNGKYGLFHLCYAVVLVTLPSVYFCMWNQITLFRSMLRTTAGYGILVILLFAYAAAHKYLDAIKAFLA
jgi:hypothetical protein